MTFATTFATAAQVRGAARMFRLGPRNHRQLMATMMVLVTDGQPKGTDAASLTDNRSTTINGASPKGAPPMTRIKDIAGQTRGDLQVIERVGSVPGSKLVVWSVHCWGCGGTFSARGSEWRRGAVSCRWCRAADRELVSHPADKSRSFPDPAAGIRRPVAGVLINQKVTT